MKQFIHHLRVLCAVLCWVVAAQSAVASGGPRSEYYDSVEVSLLTCAPHEEIYSLYGHSALRFRDLHNGQDVVLNWGTFDFKAPHFVMRFVFGLTDYELGLSNYSDFCRYYRHWGSMVTEQVLNLTADEKVALQQLVGNNLLEENRVYRYNFFYDNCSTRPRDVVERSVEGKIMYDQRPDYTPTFRDMLREKTSHHPWATFGNDMLLGLLADRPTTLRQQEFLPDHLLYDFDHAQVLAPDGTSRPLVRERRLAVKPGVQLVEPDFPLTPIECGIALLVVTLLVSVGEWKRRKTYKYFDAALMLLTGLAGCVLFVMLFSQHPATTLNLQLLLVNPLHLFFLPAILRRRPTRNWTLLLAMACLFLIGGLFQHYAEGMVFLALCLLVRWWIHLRCDKKTNR